MPTPIAQKYFDEAELFRENGLCKEAIEAYKKAIETDPSFISAYYNLAVIYHQTQQFYNAITSLKKAIELDPGDASTFNNLGVLYFTINVFDEAKKYFEKSLSIEPDYKKAKNNLEKVQLKLQMIQLQSFKQSAEAGSNNKRLKIGFVSIWFERGQSYVTKTLQDVIAKYHETFVFARTGGVFGQPKLEVRGYWDIPNLTTHPDYQIPPDVLTKWIRGNNLDMVIFNEEYDWNLVMAAKASAKILTYLDYYKEDWKPYMSLYDAVLCSTKRTFNLVNGICNAHYIGWGIDTDLFKPRDDGDGKYTFFHNAGWLGINYRKMTPAVILAFEAVSRHLPDATLFVHAQTELEKLPPEVVNIVNNNTHITYYIATIPAPGLYHKGRILVFPSKLEGLGLPLLEGMACGLPAIATDAPPMNEFVQNDYNGLLVKVAERVTRGDGISFPEEIIDVNDLAFKMHFLAKNPELIHKMQQNARNSINTYHDLNKRINEIIHIVQSEHPHISTKSVSKPNIPTCYNSALKMKILYVNVIECNAGWGAEVFVDKGFRNLGHTTHCIDYRKHRDKLHHVFTELPEYDVFLLQRGDYFPIDLIESVRVPRFFWASELVSRCRDQDRLLSSGLFDHIFFRTKRCIETAVSYGWVKRDRCSILLSGFDETIHRMNSDIKRDIEILFVGSITPRRKKLLEKLQAKFNVTIASAFGEELVHLFQRSKIVLNIHAEDYQDTETRVFEVLGCGAFLLTERLSEENPFSSRQLVEFETFNELCDKIKYYLDHVNERETIAMRGYAEAVARHTYTHRADEIIRMMSTYLSKSSLDKNQYVHVTHDKFINITTNDAENSSRTTQQTHPMAFHNSLEEQIDKIRTHLANIGKVSTRKVRPRIFVAVHHVNWEKHGLVDGWAEIADVIHYDWGNSFDQYAADWHQRGKPDFNKELILRVELAHREKTIDLFFSYLSGRWVYPDTIQAIGKMNIITVNISLDDKVKFRGYQEPSGLSGNAEIAPEFDLCITTQSAEDVQKYISVGARALFLPPGGNTHSFSPIPAPRDIPVSFVGQCYGTRPHIIAWLKSCGISVQTFGKGWPSGELSHQEMNVIYSRSVVNLGFGFIGDSPLTGLKGRDFEVPLMGGLYLTTYNQDLENCFIPGEEIECYRNETDLLSKLQYYIEHPDIASHIGAAGRNRCLREHTWTNRFKTVLAVTGL